MTKQFNVVVFLLALILAGVIWTLYNTKVLYDESRNNTPLGQCPPPCTNDADAQFILDVYPNVTINYFCWNGIPQAKLIPAPDAVSGAPFGSPDPTIAYKVCRASIRHLPHAAQIFPYFNTELVYGKCGISYKCAVGYYNPS